MKSSTLLPAVAAVWLSAALAPAVFAQDDDTPPVKQPPPTLEYHPLPKGSSLPPAFGKKTPESTDDLKAIQSHVQELVRKASPAVVGLQIGPNQGSGVIISKDGYVMTAGHISGKAGQTVRVLFPNGKSLSGKSLGANFGIDSGLVKITDKVDLPYIDVAKSSELKKGDWCMALGHPGGFQPGRAPVLRLGRVLESNSKIIRTDCTLVGGDSGGPLFDMHGRVIGIHSRIGGMLSFNIHVPADTYRETWAKLAAGEEWGLGPFGMFAKGSEGWLGLRADNDTKPPRVLQVTANSPASKAGIRENDVILKIDNKDIADADAFTRTMRGRRPGARVEIEIRRGEEILVLRVTLGARPD